MRYDIETKARPDNPVLLRLDLAPSPLWIAKGEAGAEPVDLVLDGVGAGLVMRENNARVVLRFRGHYYVGIVFIPLGILFAYVIWAILRSREGRTGR